VAIEETLLLQDEMSGPAEAAASALDDVSSAAESASDALSGIEGGASDAASGAEDAADAIDEVSESAQSAGDAGSSAFEQIGEAAQGLNAALEIGKKSYQAVAAVGKIAVAFGSAVSGAKVFHDQTVAALDQLTGGRGEAALDGLAAKAQGLGISTESAVEQFTELRDAGASNMDASALIALRADLEAVGVSSDKADEAVNKALSDIKGGKAAGDAIRDVAKGFGAVGDGANAAAKRSLTWAGALQNIQGLGGRIFGVIAEQAGPALDAVGAKITSVLDAFEDSGAVGAFGQVLSSALEYVPPIIEGILVAWDALMEAAGPSVTALGESFSELGDALGDTGDGMSVASAIGTALGYVIGGIANAIGFAVSVIAGFISAWGAVSGAVSSAVDTVSGAIDAISGLSLADAGTALIQGFIDGILSMAGAVMDAAANVAGAAADAVAGALGIASPSKVGLEMGANLGESVGSGTEDAMPPEIDAPTMAMGAANENGKSGSTAGGPIEITIHINAGGGNATDIEAAARRGVIQGLRDAGVTTRAA